MVPFPRMDRHAVFVRNRAESFRLRVKDILLGWVGGAMNALHSPAKLRPFEYVDPITDETVYLYTDRRLSVLCVGARRFYFDRITGRFDGVSACTDRVPGRVEF